MTSYADRLANYDSRQQDYMAQAWDKILDHPEGVTLTFPTVQKRNRMNFLLNFHRKALRTQWEGNQDMSELMRVPEMDASSITVGDDTTLLISPGSLCPEFEVVSNPTPTS